MIHRRAYRPPTKEKGISFNSLMGAMVHNEVKTETRRPLSFKPGPSFPYPRVMKKRLWKWAFYEKSKGGASTPDKGIWCPYGGPGQLLWVREPYWVKDNPTGASAGEFYNYHGDLPSGTSVPGGKIMRPADMPRLFCRTTLQVESVGVQPLQDITDDQAQMEGFISGKSGFYDQWERIYREQEDKRWDSNPWVWIIRFKVLIKSPFRVF